METRNQKASRANKGLSPIAIFGPVPIIPGENPADYDEVLLRTTSALKPADIIEEMFLDDIVRATWDIIRLRRLQNGLLIARTHEGLERVLGPLVDRSEPQPKNIFEKSGRQSTTDWKAEELAARWRAQDPEVLEQVAVMLKEAGLSMNEVMAETLSLKIADINAIDSLIMTAQERRYGALRELDRRRLQFGQSVRQFTHNLEAKEVKALNGGGPTVTSDQSPPQAKS